MLTVDSIPGKNIYASRPKVSWLSAFGATSHKHTTGDGLFSMISSISLITSSVNFGKRSKACKINLATESGEEGEGALPP